MKYYTLSLFTFLSITLSVFSQTEFVPETYGTFGGSTEISDGYTVSFSAGQTFYRSYENADFSVSEGFNIDIEIITDIPEMIEPNMSLNVYPIPTEGSLNIDVVNEGNLIIYYSLFDINGKLLLKNRIFDHKEQIDLSSVPNNIYFLEISYDQGLIRTYKIVKSK
jgi:hypothetical protein